VTPGDLLGQRARLSPDTVALVCAATKRNFTYSELDRRAWQCARVWVQLCSLQPGDRVCLLSENRVEYVEAFWSAGKSGIILVPLGTRSTAHELSQVVADCQPRCLMYSASYENLVKELCGLVRIEHLIHLDSEGHVAKSIDYNTAKAQVRVEPFSARLSSEDIFCLLYTSGTTGRPKGVMIPHRQVAWNAYNTVMSWQLRATDRVQVYTPMYHAGGLTVFMAPMFAIGGSVVLHNGFDPAELLSAFVEYRCTILFGVPTTYRILLKTPEFASTDFSHLRWCCSGGAPLPLDLLRAYQERGFVFRQGYGLTEVGVNCFAMSDEESRRKAGSVGKPIMFLEAKLIDSAGRPVPVNEVGELCFRGAEVCRGYWNNPEATAQVLDPEGWFHTGDLARRDEEGFFYISGRAKDMIISGAVNIYPAEIENVLLQHSGVAEAAVIGISDEKWGEVPIAFVALKPEAHSSASELIEFLRPKISKIKLPRQVVFVDALPRNAYGKVLKDELQNQWRNPKSSLTGESHSGSRRRKRSEGDL